MIANNRNISWYLVFALVAFSVLPVAAQAENLNFKSAKTNYNVGDSFTVSLTLDTKGQSINTISGTVVVPTSKLQILDVRYGNSIVTLWVERPKADAPSGTITFTGGIPGGFSGSAGPILSFGVKARAEGSATIILKDIKILLNDGRGTELAATSGTLKLAISKAQPKPAPAPSAPAAEEKPEETYAPLPDTTPPESFVPLVSHHPSVAENKYFVSFFAVDKDSGVAGYEVREEPIILSSITSRFNIDFMKTESPYVLQGQYWAYNVNVRAYDQAGNYVDAYARKSFHSNLMAMFVLILTLAAVLITRWVYNKPRPARKAARKLV